MAERKPSTCAKKSVLFQNHKESKTVLKGNTVNINIFVIGSSESATQGDKS